MMKNDSTIIVSVLNKQPWGKGGNSSVYQQFGGLEKGVLLSQKTVIFRVVRVGRTLITGAGVPQPYFTRQFPECLLQTQFFFILPFWRTSSVAPPFKSLEDRWNRNGDWNGTRCDFRQHFLHQKVDLQSKRTHHDSVQLL